MDGPLGLNSTQWVERKRWFEALRFELTTKNGWETVRWAAAGAKTESVAIDMELAITGHVYIGNGVSTSENWLRLVTKIFNRSFRTSLVM